MQPTTTRSQNRLNLHRSRTMLIAAGTIALAVLAAGCAASTKQPATSNSATSITVDYHHGGASLGGGRDQKRITAKLTTVAEFPVGYFLENVAVRADGSMLVTELSKKGSGTFPPRPGALRSGRCSSTPSTSRRSISPKHSGTCSMWAQAIT